MCACEVAHESISPAWFRTTFIGRLVGMLLKSPIYLYVSNVRNDGADSRLLTAITYRPISAACRVTFANSQAFTRRYVLLYSGPDSPPLAQNLGALSIPRDSKSVGRLTCVTKSWTGPRTGCMTVTLPTPFPTNQSPPKASVGSPTREYGVMLVAMMGHFVRIPSPAPRAPL